MRKNRDKSQTLLRGGIGLAACALAAVSIALVSPASADPASSPRRMHAPPAAPMPSPLTKAELPSAEHWRTGVKKTLEAYEAALEQKDMARLERIWLFYPGSIYRIRWESKFRRPEPLDISIDVLSIEKGANDQVTVRYQQKESSPARSRTYAYKAVLLRRESTGEWQMIENRLQKN